MRPGMRPLHVRRTSASGPTSPSLSPLHHHSRAGSISGVGSARKAQTTKAAAQRLAQVMAHQPTNSNDYDDDDDDLDLEYSPVAARGSSGFGLAPGRPGRPPSPMSHRQPTEQAPSARATPSAVRSSTAVNSVEHPPAIRLTSSGGARSSTASTDYVVEQQPSPLPSRSVSVGQLSHLTDSVEQPPYAHSVGRSPHSVSSKEQQHPSGRSTVTARSPFGAKAVPMVPSSVPLSLRPTVSGIPIEASVNHRRDKRLSMDFGSLKRPGNQQSAIQDELDILQEENESLHEKLRIAEDRCEEAEERAKLLEKQVASLGEGVSMEARLLSRKEAALQQREAALKVVEKTHGGRGDQMTTLRMELESAREEATSAMEQLQSAEIEIRSLRIMTKRMILTHEEKEEVVLKRCWLARHWGLCVQYMNTDAEERERIAHDSHEFNGEENIESMLLVDKGLRELVSLKVEDAVLLAMAQQRRPQSLKFDDVKLPIEGQIEAFELSQEEAEDVLFKRAWLAYFWGRAKNRELECDIAEDRLQVWTTQINRAPTSQDAVDVARGLKELQKLGIEAQLWEESRKWIDEN